MFEVYIKRCDQCLFSDNKIVDEKRRTQLINNCLKKGTHFICHKATLDGDKDICCRGFYDTFQNIVRKIVLAKAWNLVTFVELPKTP